MGLSQRKLGWIQGMLNNEEQSRPNDSRPGSLFDGPSILEDIWLDQLLGAF
ncbi:hypothetical protein FH972_009697 [Carpinus fangiana]|uniref:Uncharacterized protein n=1 Tax=Carpinus fangiana TaxID=176857 RepID=A0A660KMP1_9ROSI|nr:hypothetical protein FH972_009697 [Carpinus fangiana]